MEHRHREGHWEHRIEMATSISSPGKMMRRGASLIGLAAYVVCLLLIFGSIGYQSSWAQDQGGESNSINGNQEETTLYTTEQMTGYLEYPVTLNNVTLGNRITWAAQAIVAPERLEDLVPIYVYNRNDAQGIVSAYPLSDYPNLHVGVAVNVEGADQEIWRARPVSPGEFDILVTTFAGETGNGVGDSLSIGDYSYIVSSRPIDGVSAVQQLWIPERDWQDGLNQAQQFFSGAADE